MRRGTQESRANAVFGHCASLKMASSCVAAKHTSCPLLPSYMKSFSGLLV